MPSAPPPPHPDPGKGAVTAWGRCLASNIPFPEASPPWHDDFDPRVVPAWSAVLRINRKGAPGREAGTLAGELWQWSKQERSWGLDQDSLVRCAIKFGVEAAGLADGVCLRTSRSEGKRRIQDDWEDRSLSKRRDSGTVFCGRRAQERPLHVWGAEEESSLGAY